MPHIVYTYLLVTRARRLTELILLAGNVETSKRSQIWQTLSTLFTRFLQLRK